MPHRSTAANSCELFTLLLDRVKAGLTIAGRRLHAGPDAAAARHGWQITSTRWGLGRIYRAPHFSGLASCQDCDGRGATGTGHPCRTCGGRGRTDIGPATETPAVPPTGDQP